MPQLTRQKAETPMPTYEIGPEFVRDWQRLTPEQQTRFKDARDNFVSDLKQRSQLRSGFRIKRFRGQENVWEFSYEGDGRALFMYGTSPIPGEAHIIWLRIGTHEIFKQP